MDNNVPKHIHFHQASQILEVIFDQQTFNLSAEYLRVFSPSAEVRGHGRTQPKLVSAKRHVRITKIEPVGNYSIKLTFDDGHDTGLYTWKMLYELGQNESANWQEYMQRLSQAGESREVLDNSKVLYKKV